MGMCKSSIVFGSGSSPKSIGCLVRNSNMENRRCGHNSMLIRDCVFRTEYSGIGTTTTTTSVPYACFDDATPRTATSNIDCWATDVRVIHPIVTVS
jgi:hypothetical protein